MTITKHNPEDLKEIDFLYREIARLEEIIKDQAYEITELNHTLYANGI